MPKQHCAQEYYNAVVEYSRNRSISSCLDVVHFIDQDAGMIELIQRTFSRLFFIGVVPSCSKHVCIPQQPQRPRRFAGTLRQHSGYDKYPKNSLAEEEATDCCICMDEYTNPKKLGCGHIFCTGCIEQQFKYKPSCPQCGAVFGKMYGNQPPGTVKITTSRRHLPGYYGDGSIEINYDIPAGRQTV